MEPSNEITVIEKQTNEAVEKARALVVNDTQSYESACALSISYKGLEKMIKSTFKPMKDKAKAAHDEVCAQEKRHLAPVLEVQNIVDSKAISWYRKEEERKNKERMEQEERAKKIEEERRLREAEHAEKMGDNDSVETILEEPLPIPVVPIEAPAKVSGFGIVQRWDYEIINPKLLPLEYLEPDLKKIGQVVRAMKDKTAIPGIRVFSVDKTRKTA